MSNSTATPPLDNRTVDEWFHGPLNTALIVYAASLSVTLTVVGNILVCLAVILVRKLRQQPPNYLLFSLAATDLGVGVIVQPLNIVHELNGGTWTLGRFMCRLYTTADLTFCTASILTLCAINVDRYLAISKPFTYCAKRTVKRCLSYVLITWLLAILISATPLVLFPHDPMQPDFICQIPQDITYQIYATLVSAPTLAPQETPPSTVHLLHLNAGAFYVPACIILVVNYKIYQAARRLTRHDKLMLAEGMSSFNLHNNENNIEKMQQKNFHKNASILLQNSEENHHLAAVEKTIHKKSRKRASIGRHVTVLNEPWSRQRVSVETLQFGHMWQSIKKHLSRSSTGSSRRGSQKHRMENESKAMKTLGVVTGAFLIGWLPFFVLALLKAVCGNRKIQCNLSVPRWLDCLLAWLGYLNSALNPFIYAKYNRDFRIPFREMLCCRFSTLKSVLRHEEFVEHYGISSSTKFTHFNPGGHTEIVEEESAGRINEEPA